MKLPPVCVVVFALLLVGTTATVASVVSTDPELKQYCKHQCKVQVQQEIDEGQKRKCIQDCERNHQEKQQRERQEGGGRGEGSGNDEQERYGQGGGQQEESPYVFEDRHFTTKIQTQHGRVRVLPRFTQRSELLRGIDNYRFAVLEAEPNTFIIPNHMDAEAVIFVVNGNGAVSFLNEDRRESFDIRRGDIFRVPAGITTYLINRDNNRRLTLAKLLQPVSSPGRFETFFGAGGENPESFYRAFSNGILEAAFNLRREGFQRIFGQQTQGVIIKASEQQIRALSRHEGTGIWPFRGESKSTFNIFDKRPSQSNQFGQLYEVDFNKYRRLQDLDVAISLANISRGGMTAPIYNSKATKVAFVTNGEGYFEMACPHLSASGSEQEQQESRGPPSYHRVSAPLRLGTVIIVPPGHPLVVVASNNQNLEVVCFEINAFRNEKFPLAGKRNVFRHLEREAKELAFGVPAREVEEVFNKQQEEYFFRGPHQQQQQEGRAEE